MVVRIIDAVPLTEDVYHVILFSETLNRSFSRVVHDRRGRIREIVSTGDKTASVEESLLDWTPEDGQREIDFYDGKLPPDHYATIALQLDEVLMGEVEERCAARGITAERLIASFLKFIVQPENAGWLEHWIKSIAYE